MIKDSLQNIQWLHYICNLIFYMQIISLCLYFDICCCRSNQSILKEISPEYSLKGLMLKLHYIGYPMQRADSLGKTLILGKIEGRKRRGRQRMRWSMASLIQWT